MFDNFPKIREALPQAYQEIYEQFYKSNREGEGGSKWLSPKARALATLQSSQ